MIKIVMSLILIFFSNEIYAQRGKNKSKKSNKRSASAASKVSGGGSSSLRSASPRSNRRQASISPTARNVQYIEIEDESDNAKTSEITEKYDEQIKNLEEKYNDAMEKITSYQEQLTTLTTSLDELKIKVEKSVEVADKFYPKGKFVLNSERKTLIKTDTAYICKSLDGKETLYTGKCNIKGTRQIDQLGILQRYECSYYQEVCEKGLLVKGLHLLNH